MGRLFFSDGPPLPCWCIMDAKGGGMMIGWKRILAAGMIAFLLGSSTASACTLWAASGDVVDGGGTLLVKNRDWYPNHEQVLRIVHPKDGYAYFGLYAKNKAYSGFKAGINEKGLVIVSASASSIPRKERKQMKYTGAVIRHVLSHCSTAEEAAAYLKTVEGPQFLLFGDKIQSGTAEIGPDGKNSIHMVQNGSIAHTNHYTDPSLTGYNELLSRSSHVRYTRIEDLLRETARPYTMDTFLQFSRDQNAGPDDSILRTGSTKKSEATIATWAVRIPEEGSPTLFVHIRNPGNREISYKLRSDDVFRGAWKLPGEPEDTGAQDEF